MHRKRLVRAIALLSSLVLLPGWSLGARAVVAPAVQGPQHLWVGTIMSGAVPGPILRYTLREGLPAPRPDTVIEHFGLFEAVGPGGEMYSLLGHNTFYAFAPGATRPYRKFDIPLDPRGSVVGCAVDSQGDLWVEYRHSGDPRFSRVAPLMPLSGIMEFSAHARGKAEPLQMFATPGNPGFAINADDDMFINVLRRGEYAVEKLEHILKSPNLSTYYQDGFVDDSGAPIATDGVGDLFVRTHVTNLRDGVVVWTPGADPIGYPSSVIETQFEHIIAVAASPHYVYLIEEGNNAVLIYHAHETGFQQPLTSLFIRYQVPYVVAAAV